MICKPSVTMIVWLWTISSERVSDCRMDEPSPEDIRKFRLAGERRNFQHRKIEILPGRVGCCRSTDSILRI